MRRGQALAHGHQAGGVGARAEARRGQAVLGDEDRLARGGERRSRSHSSNWKHCSTTAKSKAGSSAATWSRSFLSAIGEPARVRRAGEEAVEAQLVGGRQREAAGVGVGVDVVRLDAVEALVAAGVEPALDDGPSTSRRRTSSQRSPGQPVERAAGHRARKARHVRAEPLERAGAHVTDHPPPCACSRRRSPRRGLEQVDVVDRGSTECRAGRQLPLPGRPRRRHPAGGRAGVRTRAWGARRSPRQGRRA